MRTLFKKAVVMVITWEARLVLRKYRPKIVAVTGSVGKTSTKDAIYAVLSTGARVRKSEKSFNSEVGLPLTILGVPNAWSNPFRWLQNIIDGVFILMFNVQYPEWLVLEVGADRPGDIRGLATWLPVDIAVITLLPEMPVHVEFFDSAEAVVEEKAALIDALKPGGALVLFADDPRTLNLQHRLPAPDALGRSPFGHSPTGEPMGETRIITFGFGEGADVRGEHVTLLAEEGKGAWPTGMTAEISCGGSKAPLKVVGAAGAHAFVPALAAAAVGYALDKPLGGIIAALGSYSPPPGRMRLMPGIKGTLIIDDSYNSSPAAAAAALTTLGMIKTTGRKVAALADMMELGRHSAEEHRKVGERVAAHADFLVTVGFRARDIAQGALDNGMPESAILQFEDSGKAGAELQNIIGEGDCILIKGSQSTRMERMVEELMAEPERAEELLVRQDEEWKRR